MTAGEIDRFLAEKVMGWTADDDGSCLRWRVAECEYWYVYQKESAS